MNSATRRAALLERMADHVLAEGLAGASLRPLAAAAGTSDRMLLYYFPDKDSILLGIFDVFAARFAALLAQADISPVSAEVLRARLWDLFNTPAAKPYIAVYLELCIAAGRGEQPHGQVAARIAEVFLPWATAQLDLADAAERRRAALLVLASVDGLILLAGSGMDVAGTLG